MYTRWQFSVVVEMKIKCVYESWQLYISIIFHKFHDCDLFDIGQEKVSVNGKTKEKKIGMDKTKSVLNIRILE